MNRPAAQRLIRQQAVIRDRQRDRIDQIHALCHEFMRDMDRDESSMTRARCAYCARRRKLETHGTFRLCQLCVSRWQDVLLGIRAVKTLDNEKKRA